MGILIRRRKSETVTITHEFLRVHVSSEAITTWCARCEDETKLLSPEDTAILTGLSVRDLYREAEIGRIHFKEFSNGSLLICLNSVSETGCADEVSHSGDLIRRRSE